MADCQSVCCGSECITFLHSMGIPTPGECPAPPIGFNSSPCMDLGGPPSPFPIMHGLDNLFHSIGPKMSRRGHEDYRCFYIVNMNATASLRNAVIFLDGPGRQVPGKRSGSYVALGFKLEDAIQVVTVTGPAPPREGEYFELKVPCYDSFKVYYDPNITKWIGNFQSAIRAVEAFSEVVVTGAGQIGTTLDNPGVSVTFTVNFGGNYLSRNQGHKGMNERRKWMQAARHKIKIMEVTDNTLLNNIVTPAVIQEGGPVNTYAETVASEETAPAGVTFDYPTRGNPVRIGDLQPLEYIPVWVRRTLPIVETYYGPLARSGQMAKLLDNFTIVVEGTSP